MYQETSHESDQMQVQELLDEINCCLYYIQHEIQCEDYAAAEADVLDLTEHAGNLQQLLHLIPLRVEIPRSFGDASDSEIYDVVNLEVTCNEIAAEILDIVAAVEAHLSEAPDRFNDIAVAYAFSVAFCTEYAELIKKDVSPVNNHEKVRLRLRDSQDNGHGFMFDQLTNCTLLRLWLDDLLNISSVGLKINFTITKSYDVPKKWKPDSL